MRLHANPTSFLETDGVLFPRLPYARYEREVEAVAGGVVNPRLRAGAGEHPCAVERDHHLAVSSEEMLSLLLLRSYSFLRCCV